LTEYTIELQTIHGIADSDYLDRLAEIVHEVDDLVDPLLGLNDDGSIDASFVVNAESAHGAALKTLDAFSVALGEAGPLRLPTDAEIAQHDATVESYSVRPSGDREKVYA
jgi:hypothetical protein